MKRRKILPFILLPLFTLSSLSGCSKSTNDETLVLRVLNSGDYIYENDPDNGYTNDDLLIQYQNWINEPDNKEKYFGKGFDKNVEVVYDTYDVNETMYNELKTGKSSYDLICTSDYMLQKLAKLGMIQKADFSKVENYTTYASQFLIGENGKLAQVEIDSSNKELGTLNDYTIGYMWGTLGIMFNPTYSKINNREEDDVISDFCSPDGRETLWNKMEYYKGCMSIKDSMRDCYAMGLAHALVDENGENEFKKLYDEYSGNYNDEYNEKISDLFNKCDDETIEKVEETLIELKENIYGFEVDTGKSDIVKGLVGINLCWSGDAVYSMDTAEDDGILLYYSIPDYITNIWFDGFALTSSVEGEQKEAAYSFLDFLSMPQNAAQNMDYVGYTPFIGGDDMFSLIEEYYDNRIQYDENDEVIVDEDGNYVLDDTVSGYLYDLSYFYKNSDDDTKSYVIQCNEDQINRQLRAQYPMKSDLPHLAIMKDFGDQNDKIVKMWENVKVNPLPAWVISIVVIFFVLLLVFLGTFKLIKKARIKNRIKMRNN